MTGVVLLIGIVLATLATVAVLVAGLAGVHPPLHAGHAIGAVKTWVECPHTNRITRIRVASDTTTRVFTLVGCERFGTGHVNCDRECLPALH